MIFRELASLRIFPFTGGNGALLIAFLRLEGRVVDVFSASKRGGELFGKRCAVESDMLKGIFISKMVLWVKLLVCPWSSWCQVGVSLGLFSSIVSQESL